MAAMHGKVARYSTNASWTLKLWRHCQARCHQQPVLLDMTLDAAAWLSSTHFMFHVSAEIARLSELHCSGRRIVT
jgi:hypothetical protein